MIRLCEMKESDIPLVISFLENTSEDFMNQWGGGRWYRYPVTIEQMTTQFNTRRQHTRYYMIMKHEKPIGSVELDFIDWDEKKCSVCRFIIKAEARTNGYGTKALIALKEHAFSVLGMRNVDLSVFDFNIAAKKCYEKAGFIEYRRETRDNGWVAVKMEAIR